jgi:hypothetical protein
MKEEELIEKIKEKLNDVYDQYNANGFYGVVKTVDVFESNNEMITRSVSGMGISLDNEGLIMFDSKDKGLNFQFISNTQTDIKKSLSVFVDNVNISKDMLIKLSNFIDNLLKSFDEIDFKRMDSNDTSLN